MMIQTEVRNLEDEEKKGGKALAKCGNLVNRRKENNIDVADCLVGIRQ